MCGDDLPASAYAHRFGALAVMGPPVSSASSSPASISSSGTASLSGSITFFNDTDHDCPVATHVRFAPAGTLPAGGCSSLLFSIHDFDDVQLGVPGAPMAPLLHRLRKPLHLHVGEDQDGNQGIIGRRVTMYASAAEQTPAIVVAEGIVGYNSLPRVESSL